MNFDPPDKIAVCILAAGIAKRLEPLSRLLAKPAFPLAGQVPIVEHWIKKFVAAGLRTFVLNLHRIPDSIQSVLQDGHQYGAQISYVYEEQPSGTLGGVLKMLAHLQSQGHSIERLFVPSGDIFASISATQLQQMLAQHRKHGAVFSMMLAPVPWERRADYGTAVLEGFEPGSTIPANTYRRITHFMEKDPDSPSNENNASNYLIETHLLTALKPYLTAASLQVAQPCYDFGKHVIMGMMGKWPHLRWLEKYRQHLYGYEPGTSWYDIGNKRDYLRLNQDILDQKVALEIPYQRQPWGWCGREVAWNPEQIELHPPVLIGHHCKLAPGSTIGPHVILGDGWHIGPDCHIRNAIFWPHYPYAAQGTQQEVSAGITIDTAIVSGGQIKQNLSTSTASIDEQGQLLIKPLDWTPPGKRA